MTPVLLGMSERYFLQAGDVVLFLGNSITAQAQPMVDTLEADLRANWPALAGRVRFILSGVGGEQAFEGGRRLPGLIEEHKPTVCVVGYGTCEVTFRNEGSFVPAMGEILGRLREAGVAATVVSAPPAEEGNWQQTPWPASRFLEGLPVMAGQARELAAKEGVAFVDAYEALRRAGEGCTTDGIHLNSHGYRVLAGALRAVWECGRRTPETA